MESLALVARREDPGVQQPGWNREAVGRRHTPPQELGIIDEDAKQLQVKLRKFSPDGSILAGYGGGPSPEVVFWPAPRDERPVK